MGVTQLFFIFPNASTVNLKICQLTPKDLHIILHMNNPYAARFDHPIMSKSKKHKKPNIPPSALARPRLDALLDATPQDLDIVSEHVAALMHELGNTPVLDSLVKRVETASPEEQERLRVLAARLRTDADVTYLWNLVKRQGGMSDDAKRAALFVLQAMGEEVALDDAARYLPTPRPKSTSKDKEPQSRPVEEPLTFEGFAEEEKVEELSEQDKERIGEIIAESAFTPPIEQFLNFGEPDEFDSRDYLQDGITAADIPELIRMATSHELNRAPFPSSLVWARIHAWRAVGQLRAAEAVQPLLDLLKYIDEDQDDWIGEDLPRVFGQLGPVALAPLGAYLDDAANPLWARVAAEESIHNIGKNFPEARSECIEWLTRTLKQFTENDPILNADVIYALTRLQATETLPLIETAFAADRVDEMVNGDWEDIQIQLGLKTARSKPRRKTLLDAFHLR